MPTFNCPRPCEQTHCHVLQSLCEKIRAEQSDTLVCENVCECPGDLVWDGINCVLPGTCDCENPLDSTGTYPIQVKHIAALDSLWRRADS